ncbi:hypothetical protein RCG17_03200 [Neobacillus sp. PS3-12]|uniref:hypothetical protein n=1 Tax=Neobacillus sp. PS3-12 TaxID=3070677 RepID=UPI0027DF36D2|nr:hypothetical protein [Neobacillus sp. PS3-12]WML53699.1 hypothetical protein RCG17_03200 [Neobacillus sp. PS3-12]
MPKAQPDFTKSPYFVDEPGNWHLREGAPQKLQKELQQYLESLTEIDDSGTINGNTIDFPHNR